MGKLHALGMFLGDLGYPDLGSLQDVGKTPEGMVAHIMYCIHAGSGPGRLLIQWRTMEGCTSYQPGIGPGVLYTDPLTGRCGVSLPTRTSR